MAMFRDADGENHSSRNPADMTPCSCGGLRGPRGSHRPQREGSVSLASPESLAPCPKARVLQRKPPRLVPGSGAAWRRWPKPGAGWQHGLGPGSRTVAGPGGHWAKPSAGRRSWLPVCTLLHVSTSSSVPAPPPSPLPPPAALLPLPPVFPASQPILQDQLSRVYTALSQAYCLPGQHHCPINGLLGADTQ